MKLRRLVGLSLAMLAMAAVFATASVAVAEPLTVPAMPTLNVVIDGVGSWQHSGTASWITTDTGVFAVNQAAVRAWATDVIAPGIYVKRVDLARKLDKKRKKIILTAPMAGRHLDVDAAVAAITAELLSEANGNAPQVVKLTPVVDNPNFGGKALVVFKHEKRVYLYEGTKLLKKYRIAIGVAKYPTPTGAFRIGRKVKMPTWTNPGSAWAKGMPSYIGPGPNNPLGTRALYVYSGSRDTGVRFHGVPASKNKTVGTAASHGCMRMVRKDIEKLYPLIPVGTPVYILK